MKVNHSREQLSRSLDRRVKHLMIRALEKFEDCFSDIDDTNDGQRFKGEIRTMFNDVMRAQRDELRDYDVEYKPLQLTDDNTLAITQSFMRSVQRIHFDFVNNKPRVIFCGDQKSHKVLDALRNEIGGGALIESSDGVILEIIGTEFCINSVLPIVDRYRLHKAVTENYSNWRNMVINLYRS